MIEFYCVSGYLEPYPRDITGNFQGVRVCDVTTYAIDKKQAAEKTRNYICTSQRWKDAKWRYPPDVASRSELQKRENDKYLSDAIAFQKKEKKQ